MHLAGRIGVDECHERQVVILQPSKGAFRPPLPAYQAQDLSALASRLPRFRARAGSQPLMPAVRLDMVTIRNGWFAIGDRLDGLVLTGDRKAVRETAMFTRLADRQELQRPIDLPQSEIVLDDVFLGFDAGWVKWCHWLCFALGRSSIAAGLLGNHTQIAFPEYPARPQVGFSAASWMQSLNAFGLAGRARFLPPGLYRASAIRFFWTRPDDPPTSPISMRSTRCSRTFAVHCGRVRNRRDACCFRALAQETPASARRKPRAPRGIADRSYSSGSRRNPSSQVDRMNFRSGQNVLALRHVVSSCLLVMPHGRRVAGGHEGLAAYDLMTLR
jgi:hypothetical protein